MKVKIIIGAFIMLAGIIMINSCENNSVPLPSESVPANCDTSNLTYSSGANTMKPIIDTYCAISGCHVPGGTAPTDYTSYGTMQLYIRGRQNSNFWQYLFVNKTMPYSPQPPLSSCNQNKFKAWLSAGAPQ